MAIKESDENKLTKAEVLDKLEKCLQEDLRKQRLREELYKSLCAWIRRCHG